MTLTVAFILLSAIILWFVIGAKGQWSLKAACIALTLYFSLSLSQSLSSVEGWPSTDKMPKQFQVHWAVVEEPDKITGEQGAIYLWLTSLSEEEPSSSFFLSFYEFNKDSPRAYVIPYSRKNHEKIEGILGQLKQGQGVMGGTADGNGEGDGQGKGEGDGDGHGGGGGFSNSPELYFGPLPPPKLPEK